MLEIQLVRVRVSVLGSCSLGRRSSMPEDVSSEGLRPIGKSFHGRETLEELQLWVAYAGAGTVMRDFSHGQPILEQSNISKKQGSPENNHYTVSAKILCLSTTQQRLNVTHRENKGS